MACAATGLAGRRFWRSCYGVIGMAGPVRVSQAGVRNDFFFFFSTHKNAYGRFCMIDGFGLLICKVFRLTSTVARDCDDGDLPLPPKTLRTVQPLYAGGQHSMRDSEVLLHPVGYSGTLVQMVGLT